MKRVLILIALLTACAFAQAGSAANQNQATKDEVVRLLTVINTRQQMQNLLDSMAGPMKTAELDMVKQKFEQDGHPLTERQLKAAKEFMDASIDETFKGMPMDEMIDIIVGIYQKHFTSDDIAGLTAFYTSPVGRKVMAEMPGIMQESMQQSMEVMKARMPAIMKKIDEKRDKFFEEMKKDEATK